MKPVVVLVFVLSVIMILCSCSGGSSSEAKQKNAEAMAAAESLISGTGNNAGSGASFLSSPNQTNRSSANRQNENSPISILDLSVMSDAMAYSMVINMGNDADSYIGKTVKMRGAFNYFVNPDTGSIYYACIFTDGTGCCSQPLEFVPSSQYAFPDDFPERMDDITVMGIFDTYEEGPYEYCTLRNAVIV